MQAVAAISVWARDFETALQLRQEAASHVVTSWIVCESFGQPLVRELT
jgi:hypothetical protein